MSRGRVASGGVLYAGLLIVAMGSAACEAAQAPLAPEPVGNRAPSVGIMARTTASCLPAPERGCTLEVIAVGVDLDGDTLTYSWRGESAYRSGTHCVRVPGPAGVGTARCTIRSPEEVVNAIVTVDDGHGHTATASFPLIGEGVNHPPVLELFGPMPLNWPASPTLMFVGNLRDPDEGEMCSRGVAASISGDCRSIMSNRSSCLIGGLELDVYATQLTGTCRLSVVLRDSAGMATEVVRTFSYPVIR